MARARNIKPAFFTNDTLAEVEPLGRLLFIALWTMADREGRLEDRPKRIKAEALPYDTCDTDRMLADLAKGGFIVRYEVAGRRFIQVVNFSKHQNPHIKEQASNIPPPVEHGASTVQAPDENGSSHADSPFPLTDTGYLIPDTNSVLSGTTDTDESATGGKSCPQQEILDLYATHLSHLPQIRVWSENRAKQLRARWHEAAKIGPYQTKEDGLEWWQEFFVAFEKCSIGHGVEKDGSVWTPDLQWILERRNFEKIVNGRYEPRFDEKRNASKPQESFYERDLRLKREEARKWGGGSLDDFTFDEVSNVPAIKGY